MERGDHPVAAGERLVVDVERAVGADVDLDPAQDPERLQPLVQRRDLLPLAREPVAAQVVRVVGDREVLVAARPIAAAAISSIVSCRRRPGRVRVQVAAQVAELDELRQLAAPRRLELAAFSRSSGGMNA